MKTLQFIKKIPGAWYFLFFVIVAYLGVLLVDQNLFVQSLLYFEKLILNILPFFVVVFVLMIISNYFITTEFVIKHLQGKGTKKWFYIIIGGVISSGPIYMWYPFLADLKKKGLSDGLIACFLYNRGIKVQFLPLAIVYFSWQYIIIISLAMVLVSIFQGLIINKLTKNI